jgi:glycosyltransferase involved in cell wall biosynthesis
MKIFFAPYNNGSMTSNTAEVLETLGHEAKVLTIVRSKIQEVNKQVIEIDVDLLKANGINSFFYKIYVLGLLIKYIIWADVVHWSQYSILPFDIDLRVIKLLNKKRFVEWYGSDIRIPEITASESKWYGEMFNNGYEYSHIESKDHSFRIQEKFSKYGFIPVVVPELELFLKPNLFSKLCRIQWRVFDHNKFPKSEISGVQNKITIGHAPSARFAKGTNFIIPIVEEVMNEYNINFILIENLNKEEALNKIKECDIFIDQIILGNYGAAAVEAMSCSIPTVAYIMPSVYKKGVPLHCPIINANVDNLKIELIKLIENAELRIEISRKSRLYVEEHHNIEKITRELVEAYKLF